MTRGDFRHMSPGSRNALVVFLKYPEENRVKTRLAATVGAERACGFYRESAKFVADSVRGSANWETLFFHDPPEKRKETVEWLGRDGSLFFAQSGKSLGERMSRAFVKCFSMGFENAAIIGTDCVFLTRNDVETAFGLLSGGRFDAVLGPAADGGYYLLGLRGRNDAVFADMEWSTGRVLEETVRRMRAAGLRYAFMRELADIDEEKDIRMEDIEVRDAQLAQRLRRVLGGKGETYG